MSVPRICDAGDSAVVLQLEPTIDPQVNARAIAIAQAMRQHAITGVRDVVSTYCSVAVSFDPLTTDVSARKKREPPTPPHSTVITES